MVSRHFALVRLITRRGLRTEAKQLHPLVLFQFAIKLILMGKTISFTPTPGGLPLQRCASIQFPNSPWAQTAVRFYCEWNEQQLAKPRPGRVAHCSLSAGSQSVLDVRCKKQFFPSVRIVMIANWNNTNSFPLCNAFLSVSLPINSGNI